MGMRMEKGFKGTRRKILFGKTGFTFSMLAALQDSFLSH